MQTSLLPKKELKFIQRTEHGGPTKGKRKKKRPLVPGAITHTVFKSSKAVGALSFRTNQKTVRSLLKERSRKFHIEILSFVIMKNHIHIQSRFRSSKHFQNFLRTFAAMLARKLTKASRGKAFGKFWDELAFTRVLLTRIEERALKNSFIANAIEANEGYAARNRYLDKSNGNLYRFKSARGVGTRS